MINRIINRINQLYKTINSSRFLSRSSEKRDESLVKLVRNGWVNVPSLFNANGGNIHSKELRICSDNFKAAEGNYSWPVIDETLHKFLESKSLNKLLDDYFRLAYRGRPVLQIVPNIVITKPSISPEKFVHGKHGFPAVWHTDYPTEFTIHIPLSEIDNSTPHTQYLETTHRMPASGAARTMTDDEVSVEYAKKIKARCFSSVGDALLMDVTGVHKAQLNNKWRAMIQLKYTCGSDPLIFGDESRKLIEIIKRLNNGSSEYKLLRDQMRKNLAYLEKAKFRREHKIIRDSAKTFLAYINYGI